LPRRANIQAIFRARHPLAVPGNAKIHFNGKPNLLNQINAIWAVQSQTKKYSDFQNSQITCISLAVPPHKGALAIVTDARRDAVDVDALLTNGADADGEVVWS
jgi:hypothetical protein